MRSIGLLLPLCLWGCSAVFGTPLEQEEVPAACGMCQFGENAAYGCHWSIAWEGEHYPVNGPTPSDAEHDAHGEEGMCSVERRARVSGVIRGDRFLADSFELLPFDPSLPQRAAGGHDHVH